MNIERVKDDIQRILDVFTVVHFHGILTFCASDPYILPFDRLAIEDDIPNAKSYGICIFINQEDTILDIDPSNIILGKYACTMIRQSTVRIKYIITIPVGVDYIRKGLAAYLRKQLHVSH